MRRKEKVQPGEKLAEILESYDECADELEDALQELDMVHAEIEDALDSVRESLERAREHSVHCRLEIRRFQPVSLISYIDTVECSIPFDEMAGGGV
ncbi:MAG: hypothetical protein LUF30_06225 [Lachnospiraceae bacterium]|nr:hypothetical protein [Lachnospiraceae bacterium]